jgi:hypothetical protein
VENVQTDEGGGVGVMRKRRTTLEDGRYLIYYTFGEEAGTAPELESDASNREPAAAPEAEEERSV